MSAVKLDEGAEQAITEELTRKMQDIRNAIIYGLHDAGTEAVKRAREVVIEGGVALIGAPYTVQTSNLVSSTGYGIIEDGKLIETSTFDAVGGPKGDGIEGSQTGREYLNQLARQFPQGYALILVAGMHYASYVQEIHHRDVLAGASLIAENLVRQLQAKIQRKSR